MGTSDLGTEVRFSYLVPGFAPVVEHRRTHGRMGHVLSLLSNLSLKLLGQLSKTLVAYLGEVHALHDLTRRRVLLGS